MTLSESVFDIYTDEYEEWFERNKFAYLSELELLKSVIPESGYGLEIGVGTGIFAAPLGIGFGIDPSNNMLQIAQKRNIRVVLSKGEHIPFRDEIFDHVAIIVTICFVDEPDLVLKESLRVIKNNGRIFIGFIDKDSWLGKIYLAKKHKSKFYKDAKFYSTKEIIELLKNNSFIDISIYQTIFDPPDTIKNIQHFREDFGEGGFIVICGQKNNRNGEIDDYLSSQR